MVAKEKITKADTKKYVSAFLPSIGQKTIERNKLWVCYNFISPTLCVFVATSLSAALFHAETLLIKLREESRILPLNLVDSAVSSILEVKTFFN